MTAIVIAMNDSVLLLVGAVLINLLASNASAHQRKALGPTCALLIALGVSGGYLLDSRLLAPWQLQDLRLFVLLPWLALLAWAVPHALARLGFARGHLGTLPLLAVNVLVAGLILHLGDRHDSLPAGMAWGVLGGLGLWLAWELFDDLRQRTQHDGVPAALRGLPIELLGAGVMAMAFSGLNGLFSQ